MSNKEKPTLKQEQKPKIEVKIDLSMKDAAIETLKLGGAAIAGTLAAKLACKFGPIAGLPVLYYGVKTGNLSLILGGAGMISSGTGKPTKPENGVEDRFENWLEDLKEKFLINDALNLTSTTQQQIPKSKTEVGQTNSHNPNLSDSARNEQVMPSSEINAFSMKGIDVDDPMEGIESDSRQAQPEEFGNVDFFKYKEPIQSVVSPAFFGLNSNNELY